MIANSRGSSHPKSTRRWHLLALLLAAMVSLGACNQGGECDECDDDSDCDSGRTCAEFTGGHSLCADDSTSSCMVD